MKELISLEKEEASAETPEVRRGGRPPAGTDPHKRRQIMDGAGRVFTNLGFDAASMSDVAREAQVSKATLYVYFQDKEHLFTAICSERRDRNIGELIAMLETARPLEEMLLDFGTEMLRRISHPQVIAAQRIVIGVAERMPEVGQEFFEGGAKRLVNALSEYLAQQTARGALKVTDSFLAAGQFIELTQATIFRPRLYAVMRDPPSEQEVRRVVSSAVDVFLAAYRA